jgi:ribosomal protein L37E
MTSHPQFWVSGWQRAERVPPGIAKYPRLAAERIPIRVYKAKQRAKTMTTCQLCGRQDVEPGNAFCSTCEPKASRVADVDSQASQLSKIVGSFPDLPANFTERDSQAAAIAALVASLTARLQAKGDMYQPDREWQTLATVRSALVDAQRLLAELECEQ